MGVGGKFWDLLKPYSRLEGFDYLRDKRVAVDLSFWIVQHETAIKAHVRKPHLRLTFFRTINLFSKFGAYPIFVVDGTPSPLKSQARITRFFRSSGIDISGLPTVGDGVLVERNRAFLECVQECVELLELLGIPVLKAKGEAEALCAQLNHEGHVDTCITPDSDAFLFGAKCVIKCIRTNTKEPFECYHLSDIEAGLGLKRKHLIAISLLVGNDFDLCGVQGIGLDTALRLVQTFNEDEILDRLHDIGKGFTPAVRSGIKSINDLETRSDGNTQVTRSSHCSFCGHPGSKSAHFKLFCEDCATGNGGCIRKSPGFRCACSFCDKDRVEKEDKKTQNWWIKVCHKITLEPSFPNHRIIELYLCDNHREFTAPDGYSISWGTPNTEILVDFLVFQLLWEPSYIRKMMLPMLSTIYLREMAKSSVKMLLYGQYEFHSIQRIKMRYGHQSFVVRWRKYVPTPSNNLPLEASNIGQEELAEDEEPVDRLDESIEPQIHVDNGRSFLLTDENMILVQLAFPDEVEQFLQEKELQESKRKKTLSLRSESESESPKSPGLQRSISDFYRSVKVQSHTHSRENSKTSSEKTPNEKRKQSSSNLSKSVRRRLLFG